MSSLEKLPSVDRLVSKAPALRERYGRTAMVAAARAVLADVRAHLQQGGDAKIEWSVLTGLLERRLLSRDRPALRAVFNLTGTVLHTNLGRAPMPEEAVLAVEAAMRSAVNLEYDLESGRRGDRDNIVSELLRELTGCEAVTIVNNNAAAVFLTLNTLAARKEVMISRGEQIEIGGAFRMPDIMARAGCRLREVGTTNRTHMRDYEDAIGERTGVILKVHTSNYTIRGFTAAVETVDLARLANARGVPLVIDLGSGALIDGARYGLPREPLVADSVRTGALVLFSGDKLLGGPQCGIIAGKQEIVARIKKNPLKRTLRVDKMTLAALEAVLRLYRDPDRLAQGLPTYRLLSRSRQQIAETVERLRPAFAAAVGPNVLVMAEECESEIGSGAQPEARLPSMCISLRPAKKSGAGRLLLALESMFRRLPIPVLGAISEGALRFDLRCLEDEAALIAQLANTRFAAR